MGLIRFLCTSELSRKITGNGIGGDDRIIWDRRYRDQVEEARDKFHQLIKLGYKAFLVKQGGKKCNELVTEFLPEYEELLMVSPVVAG